MRLMLGLSCGKTLFPQFPVCQKKTVRYLHGELSPPEIQERTKAAMDGLDGSDFYQACNYRATLCSEDGQAVLRGILDRRKHQGRCPQVLVLDP
jgi:RecA-family ATPase